MRFSDIVGHDHIKETLIRTADRDRIPNAYMFHGPEGVGKRTMALTFHSYLVCVESVDGDSCGSCRPCRQMAADAFVDLHIPKPDKGVIKIDEMRRVMSPLHFEPIVGPWKCMLIDDAHIMTDESANMVLKTLEEPPPRTLFILVTSTPDILPSTVMSRCFQVPFGPLPNSEVARFVKNKCDADEGDAMDAAVLSGGSIGKAMRLIESDAIKDRLGMIESFLDSLDKTPNDRLLFSEGVTSNREDTAVNMELVESVISDLVLASAGLPDSALANSDLALQLRSFAERIDVEQLMAIVAAFHEWDAARRYQPFTRSAVDRIVLSF